MVTDVCTALMPFTLPPIALDLLGVRIEVALGELMLRLGLVVGGCFAAAIGLRRVLPPDFARRHAEPLDGLAVLGLLLFAIAIMDGVTAMALARPRFVAALRARGLRPQPRPAGPAAARCSPGWGARPALTLGLCSGNANLGLLLAALADRAALELFVFVAVAQLPIYTLPLIQRPLYRRWLAGERAAVDGPTG